jgi:hypothetical protein
MKELFVGALLLCLCGCHAPASNMNRVSLGMDKQQVIEVMGDPTSTSAMQGKEYLNYALAEGCTEIHRCVATPYYIRLIGGKVDAYGRHGDFGTTELPAQKIIVEQTIERK